MMELEKKILEFIPFSFPQSFSFIKERIKKFFPSIKDSEIEEAFNKLLEQGLIYEPEPGKFKRVEEEKKKPKYKAYWSLGEGQGISVTVWENSLQLQRRVRENGEWRTEQEITLARPILEKLYIRLPHLFYLMKKKEEKE